MITESIISLTNKQSSVNISFGKLIFVDIRIYPNTNNSVSIEISFLVKYLVGFVNYIYIMNPFT